MLCRERTGGAQSWKEEFCLLAVWEVLMQMEGDCYQDMFLKESNRTWLQVALGGVTRERSIKDYSSFLAEASG